ncbi:Bacillibactin exporter [subsurface metagenome]
MSAYALPVIFFAPLMGILSDLYGRKPILIFNLVLLGASGLAITLVQKFYLVLLLRFVQGIGFSGTMPLTVALIGDYFRSEEESAAQGMRSFFNGAAAFCLPVIGGALAAFSWKYPFFLFGFPLFVAWVARSGFSGIKAKKRKTSSHYFGELTRVTKRPLILLVLAAGGLRFFLFYGFVTYLPIFLTVFLRFSAAKIGLMVGLHGLTMALTASQNGRLAARFAKSSLVLAGFIIVGLALFIIPLYPWPLLIGGLSCLSGFGDGMIGPSQNSLITQNVPQEMRGGLVSLSGVVKNVGKFLAPLLLGLVLLSHDSRAVFLMLGLTALVPAVLLYGYQTYYRISSRR